MKAKTILLTFIPFLLLFISVSTDAIATNYYVNDATLNGNDTYTTAVGAGGNNGLTPSTPKLTINQVIAIGLNAGDVVYIDGGTFTEDFVITGVVATAANPITFQGNGATKTTIQGVAGGVNYAIKLLNSSYFKFQNLRVLCAATEWAFQFYNDSDNNSISNCTIDADKYAIDIYRISGGAGAPSPDNNIVENCTITSNYVGIRIKSANLSTWSGSALVGPNNNIIRDNNITITQQGATLVYAGIELQATRPSIILRNKISQTGDAEVNGGAIALSHFCGNQVIENNYVINHSSYSTAIQSNAAISFDDNSAATVTHNSFYSESHTLYFSEGGATTLTNVNLYNNIFYSNLLNCIHFPATNAQFGYCDGNMYYAPSGNVASTNGTARNFTSWQTYDPDGASAGSEANGFNANPLYVSPAANNLDLSSTSPAIDVVNVATSVSNDIYLTARPFGPKKDVGAFESTVLPISLLYFGATCDNGNINLTWITGIETNNTYFAIERSENSTDFVEISRIDGHGEGSSSGPKTYHFNDSFDKSNAYYRIKQVDIDGKFTYSPITRSNCSSQKVILVNYGDKLEAIYPGAQNGDEVFISILTVKGQELVSKEAVLSPELSATIDINNLSSSMYIFIIKKDNEVYTTKFLKE